MKQWNKRFLKSTRGQIVQHLRRGEASVNELAAALGVTDNAVRAHLSTLERDGLVQEAGKRAAVRKPESIYVLTREAEQLFPKSYHLVLSQLIEELNARLDPEEIEAILQEVGRNLAAMRSSEYEGKAYQERLEYAMKVLTEMGGLAELQQQNGHAIIQGRSCPLGAVVAHHPEVCRLAEALLSEIVGEAVRETCDRNGTPRCIFQVDRKN